MAGLSEGQDKSALEKQIQLCHFSGSAMEEAVGDPRGPAHQHPSFFAAAVFGLVAPHSSSSLKHGSQAFGPHPRSSSSSPSLVAVAVLVSYLQEPRSGLHLCVSSADLQLLSLLGCTPSLIATPAGLLLETAMPQLPRVATLSCPFCHPLAYSHCPLVSTPPRPPASPH